MRRLTATLTALLLAGCATQAQLQAKKIVTTAEVTMENYKACLAPAEANPEYAVVYDKIAVAKSTDALDKMPTATQLNDPNRISDGEIATSLLWYANVQQCTIPAMEALATISPGFQQYFVDNQIEIADIVNDVVTTKPSFGHINQHLVALRTKEKAAAARVGQDLRNSLLAQHEQELEDRAEVTQQLLDVSVSLALSLATRQTVLIHSQRTFVTRHPQYASAPRIKAVKCRTVGQSISCGLS